MDYQAIAQGRLTSQFQKTERVKAFVRAMVAPLQDVDGLCAEFLAERWVDTAIGKQLDGCGDIVGELRQGRSDDEYRVAIRLRVFVNTSNGTPSDLINAVRSITQPTDCQYILGNNATCYLYTNGLYTPQSIIEPLNEMSPAGIERVTLAKSYGGSPFRFGGIDPPAKKNVFSNTGKQVLGNGAKLQAVVGPYKEKGAARLGGVVLPVMVSTSKVLVVGGKIVRFSVPDETKTLGHNNLTGVYQ